MELSFFNNSEIRLYHAVRFANFEGILGFSVVSIILANLLGNACLLARVQKVMVCDSLLVDFDPFFFVSCFKVRCFVMVRLIQVSIYIVV